MKKYFLTIFFAALIYVVPMAVAANCRWVPMESCSNVGSGWTKAGQDSFCSYNKDSKDKTCCCGPASEAVGCCLITTRITPGGPGSIAQKDAVINSRTKCETLSGTFFSPYPMYKVDLVAGENNCVQNKADCFWILNSSCSDVRFVSANKDSRCDGKFKPEGSTAKCCCGTEVEQTVGTVSKKTNSILNFNYDAPTNPLQTVSVPVVAGRIINALLAIIGSIFLLIIIYGGFSWMTAAGNDSKVLKGRNTLAWGVLGLVVISLAWVLTGFIFDIFSQI